MLPPKLRVVAPPVERMRPPPTRVPHERYWQPDETQRWGFVRRYWPIGVVWLAWGVGCGVIGYAIAGVGR